MKIPCIIGLVAICSIPLNGQYSDWVEAFASQILDEPPPSSENDNHLQHTMLEDLQGIDLNKASFDQLSQIPWLTIDQINQLLNHIRAHGPLVSIYEIQAVPGWDLTTIRLTIPLVSLVEKGDYYDPRKLIDKITQDKRTILTLRCKRRLELSKGYNHSVSSFQGSPYYWLMRIQQRKKGDFSFGMVAEKDPGERFLWDISKKQLGPDYLSFHLQLENRGILQRMIIGDFRAQWDQGLVFATGLNLGRQVITGPRRIHRGLIPHSGSQEYDFLRGLGVSLKFGTITLTSLYSFQHLDAQPLFQDSILNLPGRVPSIIKTGLHRTGTEVSRRKQLQEHLTGFHIRKNWSNNLHTSLAGAYRHWKLPLIRTSNQYRRFPFSGKHNVNLSGSLEYIWKNTNLYGQMAISASGGIGAVAGMTSSLSHNFSTTLHFRSFSKDFHGMLADAFGIGSNTINQRGIYWGFLYSPLTKWELAYSANMFTFPDLTESADGLTAGLEQVFQIRFIPNKKAQINLYWTNRQRQVNLKPRLNKVTHDLIEEKKHSLGLRARWQYMNKLTLQTRVQYSIRHNGHIKTEGMIAGNEVSYDANFLKFTLSLSLFNTDGFENRQYIYEKDLPSSLSIPFFDGVGVRWYYLAKFDLVKDIDFWAKIARTSYHGRNQLGSGQDVIDGSTRTDFSVQIRYFL